MEEWLVGNTRASFPEPGGLSGLLRWSVCSQGILQHSPLHTVALFWSCLASMDDTTRRYFGPDLCDSACVFNRGELFPFFLVLFHQLNKRQDRQELGTMEETSHVLYQSAKLGLQGQARMIHGKVLCSGEQLKFRHFARAKGNELVPSNQLPGHLQCKFSITACKWFP